MRTLVRGGTVISLDPQVGDLAHGEILIEDGRISAVGERVEASGAEVVDAGGMLVLPGFVDTHRHTWQAALRGIGADWTFAEYRAAMHGMLRPLYRPEDVHVGTLLGRVEALHSGVTTLLDWCHCTDTTANGDAALDALRQAPGRSVFCYSAGISTPTEPAAAELKRMRALVDDAAAGRGLVTMAVGLRGPHTTSMEVTAADVATARELGLRVSVHVHVSKAATTTQGRRPVAAMQALGLLDDQTTFVHCNGLADDELAMLADAGCSVSVSPDVELKMGFGWPMTGRLLAAGIRPTLSIDDCPSVGGDMFSTLRTTLSVQRGLDTADGRSPSLTSRDVVEFATLDGANAVGLGDQVGSITPGKQADLVLLRTDDVTIFPANNPLGSVVAAGHPGLVDTVLVAGKVVKRDGALVGVDLDALRERALRSRARIAAAAGIPLDGTWIPSPNA